MKTIKLDPQEYAQYKKDIHERTLTVLGLFMLLFSLIILTYKLHTVSLEKQKLYSVIQEIQEQQDSKYKDDMLIDISDWADIKYYAVISVDHGHTWYLIDEKRKILGNFDKLHPGLRKAIQKQHEELYKLTQEMEP